MFEAYLKDKVTTQYLCINMVEVIKDILNEYANIDIAYDFLVFLKIIDVSLNSKRRTLIGTNDIGQKEELIDYKNGKILAITFDREAQRKTYELALQNYTKFQIIYEQNDDNFSLSEVNDILKMVENGENFATIILRTGKSFRKFFQTYKELRKSEENTN